MRIAVSCNDSRGGVEPYVALALGLKAAGHDVRAIAPSDLAGMFGDVGIPVTGLAGSIQAVLQGSGGAVEQGSAGSMRLVMSEMPKIIKTWTDQVYEACQGVDVVTGGLGGMATGLPVAEKLALPFVRAELQPIGAPTDAYPAVLLSGMPSWLGGFGRRLSHTLSEFGVGMMLKPAMSAARKRLGVTGANGKHDAMAGTPVLYGFSPLVVPLPQDGPQPRIATGYWNLPPPAGWQPPADLLAFLDRPGPVVTIGFGSMMSRDPMALTDLITEAVRAAGVRAVLVAGWGGLMAQSPRDEVHFAKSVPYAWLYPRVAAVVHHGGAGTTGAALQAGIPAVVVPFMMDQPFWGARVAALGAGPAPIPRRRLTADRLAEALRVAVTDETMRSTARALGQMLQAEDGVAEAVRHYERVFASL
jgi:sterol 3beta-glucosyltransferase